MLAGPSQVAAAPTLSLSTTVAMPGDVVAATISGTAGQNWALLGSAVNRGLVFGNIALNVGTDVALLAVGTLGPSGTAVVQVTPPFVGTTLDRYYLQAVTSPSAGFVPLEASAGAIIRNGELVVGLSGPPGPPGAPGPAGPPGLSGVVSVSAVGTVPAGTTNGIAVATCPSGKVVVGGGVGSGNVNLRIYTSIPSGNSWFGVVKPFDNQPMGGSANFTVYAVCASVSP